MSHVQRFSVRIVNTLPYLAIGAAGPLFAASFLANERYATSFSMLALMAGTAGFFTLTSHHSTRMINGHVKDNSDGLLMRLSAASAEAIRAYLEPDSRWRLNLIKEISDHINDDNTITLSALEGSVHDLSDRLATLERAWRIQRGQ